MKKKTTSELVRSDNFYQEPCWMDVWHDRCDPDRLIPILESWTTDAEQLRSSVTVIRARLLITICSLN